MNRQEWDERYAATEGLVWSADANRFLVAETNGLRPGRALDLACGEGRNAVWLAARGWEVTGVDFSGVALERAAVLAAEHHVSIEWVLADATDYVPPTHAFDLVVIMYLHLPEPERKTTFTRAAAAVAPGGAILAVGHDITNLAGGYGGPQDPSVLCGPEDVAELFEGLDIANAERAQRPVPTDMGERVAIDYVVRAHRRS